MTDAVYAVAAVASVVMVAVEHARTRRQLNEILRKYEVKE
jgi:hypothetical protein